MIALGVVVAALALAALVTTFVVYLGVWRAWSRYIKLMEDSRAVERD